MSLTLQARELEELAAQAGPSFYCVDLARFTQIAERFLGAFREHYPNTFFGYSYKTNYLPALCEEAHRLGHYAEVVSGMEYALARSLGVPAERIIFNGPAKRPDALLRALRDGACVHVDHLAEVEAIARMRGNDGGGDPWVVALRCHPGALGPRASRFGLDVENGDLARAIDRLRALEGVRIVGLHAHVCPPERSAAIYRELSAYVIDVAQQHLRPDELRLVNLGGGFYSDMPPMLRAQFAHRIPSREEYAEAVGGVARARFGDEPDAPRLFLEPGISLLAGAARFVCRVVAVKSVGGRRVATTTGCIWDIMPSKARVNLPLTVVRAGGQAQAASGASLDVTGHTCMEDDVMYRGYEGPLASDDFLVFENVGAYTNVLRPPFIEPAPGIFLRRNEGEPWSLVRRPETFADVFASYGRCDRGLPR